MGSASVKINASCLRFIRKKRTIWSFKVKTLLYFGAIPLAFSLTSSCPWHSLLPVKLVPDTDWVLKIMGLGQPHQSLQKYFSIVHEDLWTGWWMKACSCRLRALIISNRRVPDGTLYRSICFFLRLCVFIQGNCGRTTAPKCLLFYFTQSKKCEA